jgi:catechol 2,3-dioxygenase-like lactoylglutathione lyase family enzyme
MKADGKKARLRRGRADGPLRSRCLWQSRDNIRGGFFVKFPILAIIFLLRWEAASAQLGSPNDAGVAMGHIHLNVRDEASEKALWLALGGTLGNELSANVAIKIPGVLILIHREKRPPTGGSVGSVIDHIGFRVPNVQAAVSKWKAAGLRVQSGVNGRQDQAFVVTPDGLKIEILQDNTMAAPIAMHHIHFFVPESEMRKMQAWYAKVWGGKPGKRGPFDTVELPGVELTFAGADSLTAPTKGRVLDHIGFEIDHLEAYCKRQEADGVKFEDQFYVAAHNIGTRHLTDPWGTYIELKEGQRQY